MLEQQRVIFKNKFKEIIVDEIPVVDVPSRSGYDMCIKVKPGSNPIKRIA
ncbi:hypothetical protein DICPUDRAFT_154187 [Dictyostelium purpureum]|uniref:Uncharacterized protein n=1 Tax=Dictyostelium purpureum TaxID=5786 RepID=F0ZQP5_DICPU|nr:uncharacterized protein DICPUDRAFT_154187 [Dictyostelium purpureum]EGC33738.1 hypothetical protein DICPUDRAFT_154187 [Dictyostelium purpureum]|eukprot:XP_003289737.1 hypothetical protein DICPUDRAFT_154187 [Dictyostelium purpureum]